MAIGYQPPRLVDNETVAGRFVSDQAGAIGEDELQALIGSEIARSVLYDKGGDSERRVKALNYVQGHMPDFPHKAGRSSYTSRETSDTIGWILPSLMRVFASSMRTVNFIPAGPGDEDMAEQASDWVNHQFYNKNSGYGVLRAASYDSLLHSYAIVKQYWEDYPAVETAHLTGITEEQIAILEENGCRVLTAAPGEPWLDPLAVQAYEQQAMAAQQPQPPPQPGMPPPQQPPLPPAPQPIETFDIKVQHTGKGGKVCYEVIPGEDFFIDPSATCLEDARFVGHREEKTRSELIEMGFDMGDVYELPAFSSTSLFREEKLAREREDDLVGDGSLHPSMEKVELFECFIKVDVDGDGISESVRAYYVGPGGSGKLLYAEEWEDEWPFDQIPCNPIPHRFDGKSAFDDVMDVQQINTTLTRQLFDNLYASNVPMMEAEEGTVLNPEMLQSPKFGGIIWRKRGSMQGAPVTQLAIPFVGEKIVEALQFTESMIEKRTGVSRTTMALDPSAYQDQTATAAQLQQQASYAKIELIARDMAELGWKKVFRKSLKILVKNQDRTEMMRLRDKWVEMDPSWWNADMDCEVNVGLGTGSAERDQMALNQIYQTQLQMAQFLQNAGSAEEAVSMTPKIVRTVTRMAQTSGIRDAAGYYPDLSEKDIPMLVQKMQEQAAAPPMEIQLEQVKQQGAQQLEQVRAQMAQQEMQARLQSDAQKMQIEAQAKMAELDATLKKEWAAEQLRMQAEANKELAQLQADMQTKEADRQAKIEIERVKGEQEAWKTKVVEQNKWDIAVLNARTQAATSVESDGGVNVAEDGEVADKNDVRHSESKQHLSALQEELRRLNETMSRPRKPLRVKRDKDGRIEGLDE